jgi:octaprenyl-diphosphate synthase
MMPGEVAENGCTKLIMIEPEREIIPMPDPLGQAYLLLDSRIQQVEESLSATFESTVELIPEVSQHLISSGGKRIRPVMLLLFANAVSAERRQQAENLAVACELLHNATLLHDDVVDRSDFRRGVPSAPQVYGNSASVLVGDFLLARALGLVVEYGDFPLMQEFSRMLASMAEGEVLQLIRSGRLNVSLPEYIEIISGKTAGLFSWCCRAGASLLDPENEKREDLACRSAGFGLAFGMAFQVTDDILDYTSSPEQSGKDLANDLLQGKATLPLLLACREDSTLQKLVEKTAESGRPSAEACQQIMEKVLAGDSIGRSMTEANRYASQAKEELISFKNGPATDILADLTDFVVARVMGFA